MPMPNLPIKTGHVFIGLAVIMGVATIGIFGGGGGGKHNNSKTQEKVETLDVVVPLIQVNEGQTLTRNDITLVKWPSAYIPKGNVFEDPYKVVGRVAKQTLFPGEPIFVQKVSGSDSKGGLPAIIPTGMRAVTIAVSEVKGVAGFVKPGDRVDVISTFEINQEGTQALKKAKTVLQDVLVLASAQNMVDDSNFDIETPEGVTRGDAVTHNAKTDKMDEKEKQKAESAQEREKRVKERQKAKKEAEKEARLVSSVTLALTPEQTETMALAEEAGEIRLSLRPDTDHAIATLEGQDSDTLMGKPAFRPMKSSGSFPPAPQVKLPPMPAPTLGAQVEFIQGNDKTLYNFNQ